MLNKVKKYIEKEELISPSGRLIVGLSGGVDSVVLLNILHRIGYQCFAAHCNFHLREEESDRDEAFASVCAQSLGVPFVQTSFDTNAFASANKISIEMAARELRYAWFEKLRQDYSAESIAVAHHLDDSVETMLLNLIRGTGIDGLTGIKPKAGKIVRPLLCLSKEEIIAYAKKENLRYVTDSSNLKDEFIRNKIRLNVLPLLRTINPSVEDAIARTIYNLKQVVEVYSAAIGKAKETVFDEEKGRISIVQLMSFDSPRALLYEILSTYGFNSKTIGDIYESLNGQSGKEFYSTACRLVKDRDMLLITQRESDQLSVEYSVMEDTRFLQEPVSLEIRHDIITQEFILTKEKSIASLDKNKLKFPLLLRRWKMGDRFFPLGMKGSQKLSDYFNNKKYSKLEKESAWLLCSGSDIVWIVGERIDERYKVTSKTTDVITILLAD